MVAGLSRITEFPDDLQSSLPVWAAVSLVRLVQPATPPTQRHGGGVGGGQGVCMGVKKVEEGCSNFIYTYILRCVYISVVT